MHISGIWNQKNIGVEDQKVDIEQEKVDIEEQKVDIGQENVDIEKIIHNKADELSPKTKEHIRNIFEVVSCDEIFGREKVMEITGLKTSAASKLIKQIKTLEIIEDVSGFGKGKYKFNCKFH